MKRQRDEDEQESLPKKAKHEYPSEDVLPIEIWCLVVEYFDCATDFHSLLLTNSMFPSYSAMEWKPHVSRIWFRINQFFACSERIKYVSRAILCYPSLASNRIHALSRAMKQRCIEIDIGRYFDGSIPILKEHVDVVFIRSSDHFKPNPVLGGLLELRRALFLENIFIRVVDMLSRYLVFWNLKSWEYATYLPETHENVRMVSAIIRKKERSQRKHLDVEVVHHQDNVSTHIKSVSWPLEDVGDPRAWVMQYLKI
jgi:hypothetical protein